MRLEGINGRVAVVTGAAGGIGRCVAESLLALGARVVAFDLQPSNIDGVLYVQVDVTDQAAVDAAFQRVEREAGAAAFLITSAGVFEPAAIQNLTLQAWRRTIDINLTGTFLCAQRALGPMRAARYGRIVTLSSGAGIDGGTEACADYAASKGAVIALSKSLSKEVACDGVTVNVVAPRVIRTSMIAGLERDLQAAIPAGRLGEPDDVASAVLFLCSAHASYVTGEVFVLNGGWW
jgi:NAD(P)-dependent dehydrogenase (short-subunit alcohol dehydrogenase family)